MNHFKEDNYIKNETKCAFTSRIRTIFSTVLLLSKAQKFVKKFNLWTKDSKWSTLLEKLYADLLMIKQYGQLNLVEFRENCREMLMKLKMENPDKDLAKIDVYTDFLTIAKDAAKTFLSIFKG